MSVYSRAVTDSARFIWPLDDTYTQIQGISGTGLTVSQVGATPSSILQSCTGGTRSYIFTGTQALYTTTGSPVTTTSGTFAIEFVIKTTHVPATEAFIFRIPNAANARLNSNGSITFQSSNSSYSTNSTGGLVNDGNWHHVVLRRDSAQRQTIWVDGAKVSDVSTFFGSFPSATQGMTVGAYSSTDTLRFQGTLDFLATYGSTGLSDQQIADHYADFAAARDALNNYSFAASAMTASSLAVQPVFSATVEETSAAMTASATFPEAQQADIDLPIMVDTYMNSLNNSGLLEQWYKFDQYKVIKNYGTGGQSGFGFTGSTDSVNQGGLQGSGCIRFTGSFQNGSISTFAPSVPAFVPEISDNDWVVGFWVKVPSAYPTNGTIFGATDNTGKSVTFNQTGNNIALQIVTSNGSHVINGANIADNNWHFIAGRLSGGVAELFVDNASQGTMTPTGLFLSNVTSAGFSLNNVPAISTTIELSQFFIGSASGITNTVLTNIYNAGSASVQAAAEIVMPAFKNDNAFNTYALSLDPYFYFKLDEVSGFPESVAQPIEITVEGSSYTQGVSTNNLRGIRFTNRDTAFGGLWTAPAGTFSANQKQTLVTYVKTTNNNNVNQITSTAGFGNQAGLSVFGVGMGFVFNNTSLLLRVFNANNQFETITDTTNYTDGQYHLLVGVKDGNSLSLYVDGKHRQTITSNYSFTDHGQLVIGGVSAATLQNFARDTTIDEVIVYNDALTANEIFDLYRSISEVMDTTATTTFPMPTFEAGFGPTITADLMTLTADMLHPQHYGPAMIAFAEIVHPNYVAEVIINDLYTAFPFEASALFEDPQFNIGEFNSAAHMNASAEFLEPTVITPGRYNANSMIANATAVEPGIVTIKGARVFADPMTSNAIFPLPPAYIQLADDDWYVRLYAGHFDGDKESIQALLSNLPNQQRIAPTSGGFLTFFDDVPTDITPTSTPNTIESEIGQFAYVEPDQYDFDEQGDLIPLNTAGNLARATISRQSTSPQPILSAGLFDPYERKAVRVTNIEFPFPGTDKGFSERPYNLEFSIRTVKDDQILAHGYYSSPTGLRRIIGVVGLSDGKIYLTQDKYTPASISVRSGVAGSTTAPHPKNFVNRAQYLLGRTNIADGQWHHVIIQQGFGSEALRTQIWVDGKLDRQLIVPGPIPGIDGTSQVRPYIMGFNSDDTLLSSDFETSAWNFYPNRFIDSRSIGLNYSAYVKSKPIKVQPFTATVSTPQDHKAAGNRARALMLFWWPKTGVLGNNPGSDGRGTIDEGKYGDLDENTFDKNLKTLDLKGDIPQQYHGWDIFPLDVTGSFGTGFTAGSAQSDMLKPGVWTSTEGYRDVNTGARRYLDLMNDIDLSQFDAIFFKNFPEQSAELDNYVREDLADSYFGLAEEDLYRDFIASLRAAVDTGISLYVTNAKLALDLGIIDSYEVISDMSEGDFDPTSNFVNNKFVTDAIGKMESGVWRDTAKNNKMRIVNTLPDLTNEAGYIWKDWMVYEPDAVLELGDPTKPFVSLEYKGNGLAVGDEFLMSDASYKNYRYEAAHFDNVKAGKVIAAFSNTINQNGVEVQNPYRNHAIVIALEPGTVLRDKPIGGKILVNFTERLSSHRRSYSRDTLGVDLIQDEWINLAYNTGQITLEKRDELLAAPYNLDRRLEAAIAAGQPTALINELKYWDSNGEYILSQRTILEDPTGSGVEKDGLGDGVRRARVNKVNKKGTFSTQSVTSTSFWFSFSYSWQYPRLQVTVPSMLTRGFRWLSDRTVDEGLVIRVEPMLALTSEMPHPLVVGDKDRTVYANAMISNARIVHAPGYALTDVSNTTLPLTATAKFGDFVKNIAADIFTATANIVQPRISGIEEDEVVVYIYSVDPILYLREDIIK
jgi:hypothetical protein